MISLEYSNHIKTFDFKSQRSQMEREAIDAVIAGQPLTPLFEKHSLSFEGRKQLLKTKLGYPHKGEEFSLFLLSVVCGHVDLVRVMIEEGLVDIEQQKTVLVGVNAETNVMHDGFGYEVGEGVTALWCAAAWAKLDIVKLLVSHGANINHKSKEGSSPLLMACQYFNSNRSRQVLLGKPDIPSQLELVKFLVENGANVTDCGRDGNTPLIAASLSGFKDPSLVVYLLEKGAEPNEKNAHGTTAFHLAAEKGCLQTVKVLIQHGANFDALDVEGLTPLQRACCRCQDEVVDFILSLDGFSREQRIGALELLGASHVTSIDTESIEYFSEGDDDDDDDENGYAAVQHGYELMLKAMKERFSPSSASILKSGVNSPLHVFNNQMESQSIEELEVLSTNNEAVIMEGFIIRDRVLGGLRSQEILQPLINEAVVLRDKGALKSAVHFYSHALSFKLVSAPQSRDILRRFIELAASMVENEAELGISDLEVVHTFLIAWLHHLQQKKEKQFGSHFELEEYLWAFDRDMLKAFYFICILSNIRTYDDKDAKRKVDMIKSIIDLNLCNSKGSNLFHLAVWDSVLEVHNKVSMSKIFQVPNLKVLQMLQHCGMNINYCDKAGNSAFHVLAAVDSHLSIVPDDFKENGGKIYIDWFLQNGAILDLKNEAGERPLDVAVSELTKAILQKL